MDGVPGLRALASDRVKLPRDRVGAEGRRQRVDVAVAIHVEGEDGGGMPAEGMPAEADVAARRRRRREERQSGQRRAERHAELSASPPGFHLAVSDGSSEMTTEQPRREHPPSHSH